MTPQASGASAWTRATGVIGAVVVEEGKDLLTVTRNGFGKRTPFAAYLRDGEPQSRGGKGLKNNTINEKTGRVAGILAVSDSDDVMLIEVAASSSAWRPRRSTPMDAAPRASS